MVAGRNPRIAAGLLVAAVLAGCSDGQARRSVDFDPVPVEVAEVGRGYAMSRLAADPGAPLSFSATGASGRAVDVGVQIRMEAGGPVYRIALRPAGVDPRELASWPGHVVLLSRSPNGAERRLAARLPSSRQLDRNGFLTTGWTRCGECFGVGGPEEGWRVAEAAAAARAPDGAESPYAAHLLVVDHPGVRFVEEAPTVSAPATVPAPSGGPLIVPQGASQAPRIVPAPEAPTATRAQYDALVSRFGSSLSPSSSIERECGIYAPGGVSDGAASDSSAREERRFRVWEACAEERIATFDQGARRLEIGRFAEAEARLARDADVPEGLRRRAEPVEREMNEARRLGREAHEAYQGFSAGLEARSRAQGTMKVEPRSGEDVIVAPGDFELKGDTDEGLPAEAEAL